MKITGSKRWVIVALCALMAFLSLAVGGAVFKKTQDRFALNI